MLENEPILMYYILQMVYFYTEEIQMAEKMTIEYFRLRSTSPIQSIEEEPVPQSYLVFMLEGEMEYVVNKKSILIGAGEALYITEGALRARPASPTSAKYYSLLFRGAPEEYTQRIPTVFRHDEIPDIINVLSMIEKLFFSRFYQSETNEIYEKRLGLLTELLLNLCSSAAVSDDKNPYIDRIIDYIRVNYKTKLTLSSIAASVHLNPSYCATLFHKETGDTIGNFIKNFRLDLAKDELARGNTVKLTAETVGFTDPYNFSKWFTKATGISPSKYRATHSVGKR